MNKKRQPSLERASYHDTRDAAGAGVIVVSTSTRRVLLGKRGPICSYPETWCPFGGMVEDTDDTPFEGAFRELMEEAGVESTGGKAIASPLYINKAANGFKFYTYLLLLAEEPEVVINEESSGYAWFPFAELNIIPNLLPGFAELIATPEWKRLAKSFGA